MKTSRIIARVATLVVFVALLILPAMLVPLAASATPGTLAAPAQGSTTTDLQMAPLNPQFVLWQARRDFNAVLASMSGHGLGLRPAPKAVVTSTAPSSRTPRLTYAPSFDLRSTGKLTSVKDQGSWGTCWAFAANGSMESWLLPGDARDFSEDHMVLTSGFDTGSTPEQKYDYGGSAWMAMAYLARWGGPVWESDDAYGDSSTPSGLSARHHVQDVSLYAKRASATDNDRVKYALTTQGAAYMAISMQGSAYGSAYYNPTTSAYYYDGSLGTNHGVLAVGWDDTYAASNFATTPPGDGAFIVKNSWGTGWGDAGYFYVSYYDTKFGRDDYAATFESVQPADNYDAVYQYDPLGSVSDLGMGTSTMWGANKFTASANSTLDAVGFYAVVPDTAYEVWHGPSQASLTKVTQGTLPQMGFHTVTLPAGRALTNGADFVVAVKLTTPGYDYPMSVEYPASGYSSAAGAAPGQSYFSSNGTSWTDLTTWNAGANICLKAYATAGGTPPPADTTPPVTTVYGWDDLWHNRDVELTLIAADEPGGSGVASVNGQFNDGTVYPIPGDSAVATIPALSDHTNDGLTKLTYWATDVAGNAETPRSLFVKIDTQGPATAGRAASGRKGRAIVLRYRITVTLSPKATAIRIVVKNSRGSTVKTFKPAARSTGIWYSVKWTPKARGTFRYSVYGKDLAGNAQRTRGSAKVVVK